MHIKRYYLYEIDFTYQLPETFLWKRKQQRKIEKNKIEHELIYTIDIFMVKSILIYK